MRIEHAAAAAAAAATKREIHVPRSIATNVNVNKNSSVMFANKLDYIFTC